MEGLELIIVGLGFIFFGVSWIFDWKMWKTNNDLLETIDLKLNMMDVDKRHLFERLHTMQHDLQQIKTRLTWSKKREKKDLKSETKLSHKTKFFKVRK